MCGRYRPALDRMALLGHDEATYGSLSVMLPGDEPNLHFNDAESPHNLLDSRLQ